MHYNTGPKDPRQKHNYAENDPPHAENGTRDSAGADGNGHGAVPPCPLRPPEPRWDNIPAELTVLPQWVNWRYVLDRKRERWTKFPYQPDGRPASSTDPATWSQFENVQTAYFTSQNKDAHHRFDGIGLMLKNDGGIVGFDFDHCLNPVTHEITDAGVAEHIALLDSYSEISPNGAGLHTFAFGRLPAEDRRLGSVEMSRQLTACSAGWKTAHI